VDRATLKQARADDLLYVDDPLYLDLLNIFFANGEAQFYFFNPFIKVLNYPCLLVISKLGKKLQLRQRVIATATVFFRRFYLKNSYCETDPFIVIAACCYVAAKAEESPVHIKNVVAEARLLFSRELSIVLSICFLCPFFYPQTKAMASSTFLQITPNLQRWNFTSLMIWNAI
jgi:cyclin-C